MVKLPKAKSFDAIELRKLFNFAIFIFCPKDVKVKDVKRAIIQIVLFILVCQLICMLRSVKLPLTRLYDKHRTLFNPNIFIISYKLQLRFHANKKGLIKALVS